MGTSLHVFICSTRNLMAGKNPLWVAKQHGHSIATMLRAYAAWAEGTTEVDVEAIKRSMNAREAPPAINLAVDLSVADALQARRALRTRLTRTSQSCANRLFRHGELAVNQPTEKLAGVEGFEPSNGGIKNMDQDNQQVAEITDRRVPSSPFDSPSLPPNLPPAIGETAVVLGPARGTTNYLLLSANLRRPTGDPASYTRSTIRSNRVESGITASSPDCCGLQRARCQRIALGPTLRLAMFVDPGGTNIVWHCSTQPSPWPWLHCAD
jgi:hypothetical protein